MGRVKKYVKKQAKRLYGYAKKRYVPNGRVDVARIAKDLNEVRKALNVERKYSNTNITTAVGFGSAYPILDYPLNGLAQGAGPANRIGDQVKWLWTSHRVHLDLNSTSTAMSASSMVRFLVIHDKEPRGDSPLTGSQLRDFVLHDVTAEGQITSFYNNDIAGGVGDRFKILRDFVVSIDNVKTKQKIVKINLNYAKMFPKTQGLRVKYGTGNVCTDDQIYILMLSNDANATPITAYTSSTRSCYVDN